MMAAPHRDSPFGGAATGRPVSLDGHSEGPSVSCIGSVAISGPRPRITTLRVHETRGGGGVAARP